MGLEVNESSSRQLLILNVYMPYNNPEHMDLFQYYLQVINNIIVDFPSPYSYAIGDFNYNLIDPNNNRFGKELISFCKEENFIVSDLEMLDTSDTFTFYSEAHHTVSWLDHVCLMLTRTVYLTTSVYCTTM